MWVETSETVWADPDIFSGFPGLLQGPKMAKICKISYKQAAQGPVPPRKMAKTSLSCDTDVG